MAEVSLEFATSESATLMLWRLVREALTGQGYRWNPDEDPTMLYLRQQREQAERHAEILRARRERRFPLSHSTRREEPPDAD